MVFGLAVPMLLLHYQKVISFHRFDWSICRIFIGIQIPLDSDIHALSTLEDVEYATGHGVYIVNKEKVDQMRILWKLTR